MEETWNNRRFLDHVLVGVGRAVVQSGGSIFIEVSALWLASVTYRKRRRHATLKVESDRPQPFSASGNLQF